MGRSRCLLANLLFLVAASDMAAIDAAAADRNPIFETLVGRGVAMDAAPPIRLPQPTLADGLSTVNQQQAAASITDDNHPWDALVRKSVVAPFVLRIQDEPPAGPVRPRRVDLWFVAFGDFERLRDEDFLTDQVDAETKPDGSEKNEGRVWTEEQLRSRNLAAEAGVRYLSARFTLFDRVRISGSMQAMLTHNPDSVILAAIQSPKFDKDPEFPNAWRASRRDESGRQQIGATQPYSGAGWYCKATRLANPAGAVLIEYHIVFDEPQGWFNGANLLRSKLPILVQDNVRKFRRRFAEQTSGAPSDQPAN